MKLHEISSKLQYIGEIKEKNRTLSKWLARVGSMNPKAILPAAIFRNVTRTMGLLSNVNIVPLNMALCSEIKFPFL